MARRKKSKRIRKRPSVVKNNPRISDDMKMSLIATGEKKHVIYSFFPHDKPNCDCKGEIDDIKLKLANLNKRDREKLKRKVGTIVCPRSKKGFKRYEIVCAKCGVPVAYVAAKDDLLTDWCDLHYYNYCDRERWYGCKTVNISPIDLKLGFECFCGNDTRDMRGAATLPPAKEIYVRLERREFGKPNSGYIAREVKGKKWPT